MYYLTHFSFRTDFNFIQESLIDTKPVIAPIASSVPLPVPTAAPVPVSLASMDSAVVMVHSQVPHLPYPHFAASMYAAPHPGSLVTGPPGMTGVSGSAPIQPPSPEQQHEQVNGSVPDVPAVEPAALVQKAMQEASAPWAEEPQDEVPLTETKQESNTWTNSNYRGEQGIRGTFKGDNQKFDVDVSSGEGRGRGGYRGRGSGNRGGSRGYYNNSRGGYQDRNGERSYQNKEQNGDRPYHNGRYNNGGSYQSQGSNYRPSNDRGSYGGGNRGNYRGGPPRGAPRGGRGQAPRDQ